MIGIVPVAFVAARAAGVVLTAVDRANHPLVHALFEIYKAEQPDGVQAPLLPVPAVATGGTATVRWETAATEAARPRFKPGSVSEEAAISLRDEEEGPVRPTARKPRPGRFGPVFGKDAKHLLVLTGAGVVESTDGGASWSKAVAPPKDLKGVSALTWLEYDPTSETLYLMKMGSELYKLSRK